jgi:hypothetical protein
MKLDDNIRWLMQDSKSLNIDLQLDEVSSDMLDVYPEGWFTSENKRITLPSALASGEIVRLSLKSITLIEVELCKGQITDALNGLHLALGEKSLCFQTEEQNVDSQHTTLRAWDKVHKYNIEAWKCHATYQHAHSVLQRLPVNNEYLDMLVPITNEDLKVAGDLTDERRFGQ